MKLERTVCTKAMTMKEKLSMIEQLKLTTLCYRDFEYKTGMRVETVKKWAQKLEDGDKWGLLSAEEKNESIVKVASESKTFNEARLAMRKKGCLYSSAHLRTRMIKLGYSFRTVKTEKSELERMRKHVKRILLSGNFKSFQAVSEIVGCSVHEVTRIAYHNDIKSKCKSGRARKEDDTRPPVKIRKPNLSPIWAMALGMRV